MKRFVKSTSLALTAAAFSLTPLAPSAFASTSEAASPRYTLTDAWLSIDGKTASAPSWFAANNTAYMPIYYVMQILQNDLGIQNQWNGRDWTMTVPSTEAVNLSNISAGSGAVSIYVNGTLVQKVNCIVYVDPASNKPTTYMPIWYVMQILQRLHILSAWDGTVGTWGMFSHINDDELAAYKKANPTLKIGVAKQVTLTPGGQPVLVIESDPGSTYTHPVTVSVVSPTLQVQNFTTDFDHYNDIGVLPLSDGTSLVAAYMGTGAHTETLSVLGRSGANGTVSLLKTFVGDNGVLAWVQDGAPQVLTTNRTYNWDLTGPDGQQDDSTINDVFQYTNGQFNQINEFKQGTFEYEPSLVTNPQVDAMTFFHYMDTSAESGAKLSADITGWKSSMYSSDFLAQVSQSDLSFLQPMSWATTLSMQTVSQTPTRVVYSTTSNGHTVYVSLQKTTNWTFSGFSVDQQPSS